MIASLRGEITQVEDTAGVIEVGGVGMRVFVPAPLRDKLLELVRASREEREIE